MIPLKIEATISGGKLCPSPKDVELLKDWLAANDRVQVAIIIRATEEARTTQQLRYLWGHVIPAVADHTGYSKDEVYGMLKYKYLRRYIDCRDGEPMYVVASLTELSKAEVTRFIEDSVAWGLYLGAEIYPPEHYGGTDDS